MAEFTSYNPATVRVIGEIIESFMLGFPEHIRQLGLIVLEKYGIRAVDPNRFYNAQPFLDAMKEMAQRFGRTWMARIGEQMAMRVELPTGRHSLEAAFRGLDKVYHSKYCGGEIGNWTYRHEGVSQGIQRGRMTSTNHYCCAFDRGTLEGFAKRFKPFGINDALVRHDDTQPCRKNGADSCTYIISWG